MTEDSRPLYKRIYEDHYKVLMIIPFLMLILSVVQIGAMYATTGEIMHRGVSLKGGVSITIPDLEADINALSADLRSSLPNADFEVRSLLQTKGVLVDASDVTPEELLVVLNRHFGGLSKDQYSIEQFGSSLGDSFFVQTLRALVLAFLFMAVVVFVAFRNLVSGLTVICAAFADIVVTLAILNVAGVRMSTAGIAALLMLIGYAVDNDVLLSTHVHKRTKGTMMERIYTAMGTGIVMSCTAIAVTIVGLLMSKSPVISQIMLILLVGSIVDIITTYIFNTGIIRLTYKQRHEHH
ncbi:MAG TPA: hypothetical protein VJH22_00080 [Candidatus Nanoarchaeia archaeon]|nr:hypothetical protein [Candidatus Nanoarchaeia archaeon]